MIYYVYILHSIYDKTLIHSQSKLTGNLHSLNNKYIPPISNHLFNKIGPLPFSSVSSWSFPAEVDSCIDPTSRDRERCSLTGSITVIMVSVYMNYYAGPWD